MKRRLVEVYGEYEATQRSNPKARKLATSILTSDARFRNKVLQSIITDEQKFSFTKDDMKIAIEYQIQTTKNLLEVCTAGAPQEQDLVNETGMLYLLYLVARMGDNHDIEFDIDPSDPRIVLWSRIHRMALTHARNMYAVCNIDNRY